MSEMNWHRVEQILAEVLEHPPSTWTEVLDRCCVGEPVALRDEIEEALRLFANGEELVFAEIGVIFAATARAIQEELTPKEGTPLSEGRYVLGKKIDQGGLKDVFNAEDTRFTPPVKRAVKMIRPEIAAAASPEALQRLQAQASLLVQLTDQRFVRVYDYGVWKGRPFFVEEFVDGISLERRQEKKWQAREAVRLVAALAGAMAEAHRLKIAHLDLKPGNILLTPKLEPKIFDFDTAKLEGDTANSNGVIGTREYMSPEAWEGDDKRIGTPADVHALGAILYELLTGKPPFDPETKTPEELKRLVTDPQVRPEGTGLTHWSERCLERMCLKCLEKDPGKRYTAAALHRDLGLWLDDRPPEGLTDVPWLDQFRFWLRRNAAVAPLLVAIAALLSLGAWLAWGALHEPSSELRYGADPVGGAPFVYEERGKLKGFEVELIETIAARLKMKPQFVPCKWDMLPQSLHRGDIDVIFNGFAWSAARGRAMNATIPYGVGAMRLIVRKGEAGPNAVRDWKDLRQRGPKGKRWVGTLRGSASEKHLKENYADDVEVETPSNGTVDVFFALRKGRLDASVQDEFTAKHYLAGDFRELEIVGAPVDPTAFVAYTHKSNPDLRDRINATLREMMRDGTLKRIYAAYGVWNKEMEKLDDMARDWPPKHEEEAESLWPALAMLAQAASVTVRLACVAMPLAMLLGLIVALGRLYGPFWLRVTLAGYVELLRGTPLLLQLAAIYFLLPEFGIFLPAFWAGALGLAINYSAYESEHYRAGVLSVPRGQMEAALTLGMTRWTALRRIILPQAMRTVVPSVTNDFIALFKDTAVCSVVAVVELTGQYQRLAVAQPQQIFTFALLAALLYLLMSYPLSLLARRLERRPQPTVG